MPTGGIRGPASMGVGIAAGIDRGAPGVAPGMGRIGVARRRRIAVIRAVRGAVILGVVIRRRVAGDEACIVLVDDGGGATPAPIAMMAGHMAEMAGPNVRLAMHPVPIGGCGA